MSSETQKKRKSKLSIFLDRLLYYFTYIIAISTWLLFTLFISFGEVLLRRREIARFLEQTAIYNSLLFLTLISLATASNRSPGVPDQSLAPPIQLSQATIGSSNDTTRSRQDYTPDPEDDDDDVPLRYLRNSQWVDNRIGKERPSPLPIPSNQRYPPSPSYSPVQSELDQSRSEYSPFPLSAKSPFVPTTAGSAGEDEQDLLDEHEANNAAEGHRNEDVSASLLHDEGARNERTSLMAKSNSGEIRWCKKCNGWKPDRCHHCRHCEQCVLKMDHHCPWVGNCVGYHNYKPFFLFINYAFLLSLYVTFEAGYEAYRFFRDPSGSGQPHQPVQLDAGSDNLRAATIAATDNWADDSGLAPAVFMMLTVMGGFISLAIGGLVFFHWYLATHNQTTLENITHAYPSALLDQIPKDAQWKADHLLTRSERNRLRWEAREINVYDLGWKTNLKNLFFGEDQPITLIGVIGALWPTGWRDKHDRRSGHFFAHDQGKFETLREFTMELRFGIKPNHEKADDSEFEHGSEDEHDEEYETDRMEEKDDGDEAGGNRRGEVKWFEV
ncbi:uncharacterized protein IL334_001898 [Kwoniella shivajii]|uniref:Palmitoyltransferase n=1 Tax=Kwoniella shivajii TaxID=564305 RepID=A0ABZ1CT67_9TREE|nr:hypothetical protein IL334_001898 [Kwoniella shivajii]